MVPEMRQRRAGIPARYLTVLAAVGSTVPMLTFAALVLWRWDAAERSRINREFVLEAAAAAQSVGRDAAGISAALETLARLPGLRNGDPAAARDPAAGFTNRTGLPLTLTDGTGGEMLNTGASGAGPAGADGGLSVTVP